MARTIDYWYNEIIAAKERQEALASLTSTSKVAIWRLFAYVIAVTVWTLDTLFDLHKSETDTKIAELKPHSLRWYRNKALAFQYGYPLVTDADYYDNTGIAEEDIDSSKIVKYAAVTEAKTESRLILKIATEKEGELQPITNPQRLAFEAYIDEVKDAGVYLSIVNYLPDLLLLNMEIYYDPLVLDASGNSIVEGGKPVEAAIKQYMKELPFNGELILEHFIDKLQQVPGVKIPHLLSASTQWIDPNVNDYGAVQPINVKKLPESGYFKVPDFNGIVYKADV